MNHTRLTLLFISAIFLVLLVALIMQLMGPQNIDKTTIHEQATELLSYTREAQLLIAQYEKGHITSTYLHHHATNLHENTMTFYDTLKDDVLPQDFEPDVRKFEPHVLALTLALKQLSQTDSNETISSVNNTITEQQTYFKKAVQYYE